ncbi:pupal cuticle protein-like [Pectinophora gossypiella]|uniref:pupal cuticle protein-like n=1 Tax=Pectinophora gossypiella TaxID=13191 RepID=UPI00214F53CD|nr:pupal cuticle protein-like [Pectinophora gossypiella]
MQSLIIFAATVCLVKASYYAHAPAPIQLSPDGKYVLDTPEVAHAKAAHLAAHAQASTAHGAWAPAIGGWGGPGPAAYGAGHYGAPAAGLYKYGPAPLAHDGRVIDTPEVAHLKAAHLQAHASASHGGLALGHAGLGLGHAIGPVAPLGHGGLGHGYAGGYGKWTGPQAHIQLTHDGQYVVDTPEVQHARAAHLAQYAHAAHAAAAAPEEPWGHGPHGGWH